MTRLPFQTRENTTAPRRVVCVLAAVLCAFVCLCGLSACGSSDAKDVQGEWQIQDTEVTVIYTEDEFKIVGQTFDYTLDADAKTISYESEGVDYGTADYTFSDDRQTLTIEQDDGEGGTDVTVFVKLSDDTSAEPTVSLSSDEDEEDAESDDGETDEQAEDTAEE